MSFPILSPPTQKAYVSSTWGKSRAYRGEGSWHEGTDFPDQKGSPAYAAGDGTVSHVDTINNSFAGKYITIAHANGVSSRYLHLNKIFVSVGQYVRKGALIGEVGDTGTVSSSPHVHFDIKLAKKYLPEWQSRYGIPSTGFGREMAQGVGVPTEAIMSGAKYDSASKAFSERLGVRFYQDDWVALLIMGAAGFAVYRLLH